MANDGEVRINVRADTSDAEKKAQQLKKSYGDVAGEVNSSRTEAAFGRLREGASKAVDAAKSAITTAAKVSAAAVGASVAAITAKATEAYSTYEQLSGGIDKLFGEEAAGRVHDYASQAYVKAGLSANAYMEQVTNLASSLKQSFGGDAVRAADSANQAIVDMSDNANIFGSNIRDIQNAYGGFAKQNYTMLDNLKLGYGGTREEMQRLIDHANELERQQGRAGDLVIDNMGDIVQAIHDVQEEQGIAGDTFEEASGTIQGSLNTTKAAWENLLTALGSGEGVDEAIDQLMDSAGTLAQNVVPVMADVLDEVVANLPELVDGIGSALEEYGPEIGDALVSAFTFAWDKVAETVSGWGVPMPEITTDDVESALQGLADAGQAVLDVLKGLAPWVAAVAAGFVAMKVVTSIVSAFQTFVAIVSTLKAASAMVSGVKALGGAFVTLAGGPVVVAAVAIAALVAAIVVLWNTNEGFRDAVTAAWEAVVSVVSSVVGAIVGFFTGTLPAAFQAVSDFFTVTIPAAFQSFVDFMANLPATILGFVAQIPVALATGVGLVIGVVLGLVASLGELAIEAGSAFLANLVSFFVQLPGQVVAFLLSALAAIASFAAQLGADAVQAGSAFLQGVVEFFTQLPGQIASFLASAISAIAAFVAQVPGQALAAGQGFLSGIQSGFQAAVSFVQGIPGQIIGFFSNAGSWLVESGRSLLGGFVSGIQSGFQAAQDAVSSGLSAVRSFFPFSPAKRGPFSGHGYTTYSGRALMRDFAGAIRDSVPDVLGDVDVALGGIQARLAPEPIAGVVPATVGAGEPSGVTVVQSFSTKVVRADEDLYAAGAILNRSAMREALGVV
jgi:phage-related protein